MILPGKHLREDRALLGIGAEILAQIDDGKSVTELWEVMNCTRDRTPAASPLSFDWFILSLCFLYAISALDLNDGLITIAAKQ